MSGENTMMDITKHLVPAALTVAMSLPFSLAHAADVNVLYPGPAENTDLGAGSYAIGGAHPTGLAFLDDFNFSLSAPQSVTFSLKDVASPDSAPSPSPSGSKLLFDNSFLTFSVFDSVGTYLGSGAEGSTLKLDNLVSGQLYTLTVSGKSTGIFGGVYSGSVDIGGTVSEVPIGATLPMFSAALLTLAIRRRKNA
jgi:hypothetical protein